MDQKYASLANNINVGIFRNVIGPNGKFIEANQAIVEMFGFNSREEFLQVRVSDLYKNPGDREKYNTKILKEGSVKNQELQLRKKDGTAFIGSVSAELFFPITRGKISGKDLATAIEGFKGDGETILVVDDVASQRDISCKMLETLGYKPRAVPSGEEAVEYLKENTVNLILLDMIMDPGINGRETYERILKLHPNQKAIIVSGFAETDEVKETQRLGAGKYIKKPLTLEKLGLVVQEELRK